METSRLAGGEMDAGELSPEGEGSVRRPPNQCLPLRVKDIDFDHGTIAIHDAKGGKHRPVPPRPFIGRTERSEIDSTEGEPEGWPRRRPSNNHDLPPYP
jgi:integrase